MESNRLEILKPELIFEIKTGTAIYKTKPLSLKVSEKYIDKFKKFLFNQTIQREILSETGLEKSFYNRIVKRFL